MRLLHYLEIQNFKRFGHQQRIDLDHPAVLIGPNNCGKTTAIQAIALWSQAVKTWLERKGRTPPRQRTSTSINRLHIVSVPVQRTRYFWHSTAVRIANRPITLQITLGILFQGQVEPVTMQFRNQGNDLVYCTPDEQTRNNPDLIQAAARINVELLYPMSGLETEEPILQPGRIDVLLGQGQTAQVLRNLCLMVRNDSPEKWQEIVNLMDRLFAIRLGNPKETVRGSIDLFFQQTDVREPLDVALAGRGFQQMLLILAYLYSHNRSVLLIDEPDAHLEILRQRQVYVLLRDIAARNQSQVVLVTHAEAILSEALDHNLTLLLAGQAENLASRPIQNALKYYGTEHYVRARQRGYVLYVEGSTDLAILQALAQRLGHTATDVWDERINVYYVQSNCPQINRDTEWERVEEGFGLRTKDHFFTLASFLPHLKGLAILDSDSQVRTGTGAGNLTIAYWSRYEVENYFVTPKVLEAYAAKAYQDQDWPLFQSSIPPVLDTLIQERIFGQPADFATWKSLSPNSAAAHLLWERSTERIKLSDFAEEFFRRLADATACPMLLRKGKLHQLVAYVDPQDIAPEVSEKLDLLQTLFASDRQEES